MVPRHEGKGQAYEINADKVFVTGFVEDPDTYPMSASATALSNSLASMLTYVLVPI